MADNDPFFSSTYMTEATSRADLIHNEFAARVAATLGVLKGVDVNTPPGSPADFDAYIVGTSPTGPWSAAAGQIAFWLNGWKFVPVKEGMKLLVAADVSGQAGRHIDYFSGGWSSVGGSQFVSAVNLSGVWTIQWDLKYGVTLRTTLTNPTTVIEKPANARYGRPVYVVVQQDATGGRLIQFKTGQWVSSGGTYTQPTATANARTAYTAIWYGPSDVGPTILGATLNLINV
jgi:hypothetical protein